MSKRAELQFHRSYADWKAIVGEEVGSIDVVCSGIIPKSNRSKEVKTFGFSRHKGSFIHFVFKNFEFNS